MQKTLTLRDAQFNVELETQAGSEAPWLTFSNSHATDLHLWDAQAALLRDRFRILRYDTRGHGRTTATPGAYSIASLAADVIAIWDEIGLASSHIVGLSLGGTTALQLGISQPERVASIVACDCRSSVTPAFSASWDPRIELARREGMNALVPSTIERWFTPEFRQGNPPVLSKISAMIAATSVDGYIGCAEALKRIDIDGGLAGITCPVKFLSGESDPSAPPDLVAAMCAKIPGATSAVIKNAQHISNIEQPDEFNGLLSAFLTAQRR